MSIDNCEHDKSSNKMKCRELYESGEDQTVACNTAQKLLELLKSLLHNNGERKITNNCGN